jgi:hypothetical protein
MCAIRQTAPPDARPCKCATGCSRRSAWTYRFLAAMAVEIRPVRTRRELGTFIKLPWRLYRDEPKWVAPLVMDLKKRLDQSKNPFFKHAQAQYLLAYRDGRPVGRISAHVDENFNRFQDNEWGLFGWFECEDDPEAARALLDTAENWLRERGRDRMVGPMDFTTNDEIGVLVAGHEYSPIILCPWHPPYYQRLFERDAGMKKAMDLYMWSLDVTGRDRVHPAIWQAAEKLESEHGIVCRNFRKRDLQQEVTRFLEVYNSSWERNWGFVPLNEEEVRHYAKDLHLSLMRTERQIASAHSSRSSCPELRASLQDLPCTRSWVSTRSVHSSPITSGTWMNGCPL